jgi:aminopeptidase
MVSIFIQEIVMTDVRVVNLAKVLVNYSVKVQPGDWVWISGSMLALPLVDEVQRCVLKAGGNPTVMLDHDDLSETYLYEASDAQLDWISPVDSMLFKKADVMISLRSAANTRSLAGIDPQRQRRRQVARREVLQTYRQRAAEGSLRWVLTYYPSLAYAQDADMSLKDYEDFVYQADCVDQPDPVAAWQAVNLRQEHLVQWLKGKKQVSLCGPNCDLSLSIQARMFINCSGLRNMPDGEIFTGPVEESVSGWVKFTYPAIYMGREVEGVSLEFKDGKVAHAHAEKNEAYLLELLDTDSGSRYLGEFAIGTNYGITRFTRSILFDEKIGGSFHMAVGSGYPETGSKNHSSLHWDFICDMRKDSEILIDGELFYQNGEFKV